MFPRRRDIAKVAAVLTLGVTAPAAAQDWAPKGNGATAAPADESGLIVRPASLLQRTLKIEGEAGEKHAGRTIRLGLQRADGTWRPIATTVATETGAFVARWRTDVAGRYPVRGIVESRDGEAGAAAVDALQTNISVFRPSIASWYGPGFWGRRTACNIKLTRSTVGVAHKKLPCGTEVEVYFRGRTAIVPVIDRGPFIRGRDWDLTRAAARLVGMKGTSRIGVLPASGTTFRKRG